LAIDATFSSILDIGLVWGAGTLFPSPPDLAHGWARQSTALRVIINPAHHQPWS